MLVHKGRHLALDFNQMLIEVEDHLGKKFKNEPVNGHTIHRMEVEIATLFKNPFVYMYRLRDEDFEFTVSADPPYSCHIRVSVDEDFLELLSKDLHSWPF